eukprot:Skav222154  [mRNA]  locus=scaffold2756:72281:75502:- [translate_table: standard]
MQAQRSLFSNAEYDEEDKEADVVYDKIDVKMDQRRLKQREKKMREQIKVPPVACFTCGRLALAAGLCSKPTEAADGTICLCMLVACERLVWRNSQECAQQKARNIS